MECWGYLWLLGNKLIIISIIKKKITDKTMFANPIMLEKTNLYFYLNQKIIDKPNKCINIHRKEQNKLKIQHTNLLL